MEHGFIHGYAPCQSIPVEGIVAGLSIWEMMFSRSRFMRTPIRIKNKIRFIFLFTDLTVMSNGSLIHGTG
jgi:hypothetical protein